MSEDKMMISNRPCGVGYGNAFDDSASINNIRDVVLTQIVVYHEILINSLTVRISVSFHLPLSIANLGFHVDALQRQLYASHTGKE